MQLLPAPARELPSRQEKISHVVLRTHGYSNTPLGGERGTEGGRVGKERVREVYQSSGSARLRSGRTIRALPISLSGSSSSASPYVQGEQVGRGRMEYRGWLFSWAQGLGFHLGLVKLFGQQHADTMWALLSTPRVRLPRLNTGYRTPRYYNCYTTTTTVQTTSCQRLSPLRCEHHYIWWKGGREGGDKSSVKKNGQRPLLTPPTPPSTRTHEQNTNIKNRSLNRGIPTRTSTPSPPPPGLGTSSACLVGQNPTCSVPALQGCEGLRSYDYGQA